MNKKDPFEMDVSALDEIFKDFDEALKSDDFSTPDMYDIPGLDMDLNMPCLEMDLDIPDMDDIPGLEMDLDIPGLDLDMDIDFDLDIDLDF